MPDYTDPYATVRRHEREIFAVSKRKFQFYYETNPKTRVTSVAVYFMQGDVKRRLTQFSDLDSAVHYAKTMAGFYG